MRENKNEMLIRVGLLAVAVLVVYSPLVVKSSNFQWSDPVFVTQGVHNADSLGLAKIWLKPRTVEYRPVTHSAFWLQWRLWGDWPPGYHIVGVLLHLAACVLLWRIFAWLRVCGAWWAALLFAVHPVAVGSVGWIAKSGHALALALAAGSALLYFQCIAKPSVGRYVAALALFALAMFSQMSVMLLPIVLLACLWWRFGSVTRLEFRSIIPFLCVAFVVGGIAIYFQSGRLVAPVDPDLVTESSFVARLLRAAGMVWFYVLSTVWPVKLAVVYPTWDVAVASLRSWLPFVGLLLVLLVAWRYRHGRGRAMLAGFGSFLLLLLPVLGFVDLPLFQFSFVADAFLYVAMAPLIALVVGFAAELYSRLGDIGRSLAVATAVLVGCLFAVSAYYRAEVFRQPIALWEDNFRKHPDHWAPHFIWGLILANYDGDDEEALKQYEQATKLKPDDWSILQQASQAERRRNQPRAALTYIDRAIELKSDFAPLHYSRAMTLRVLERYDEARVAYERALELDPEFIEAAVNLGILHTKLKQHDDAEPHLKKALELAKKYRRKEAVIEYLVGEAYFQQGKLDVAEQHLRRALTINPQLENAHFVLEMVMQAQLRQHPLPESAGAQDESKPSE
ncbi:MAG: tetratricopeptide repeat protein [Planctomycetota bacterium]|nr:MAG: tetratricopeptide repeat protein [Planctomycetota bacterium]